MFDVGFSELLIIAVVALLVLGPERLPKATRFAGLWVRKARAQWYSVRGMNSLKSVLSPKAPGSVVKKLGQPVPLSNFMSASNSAASQPAQW